jgi:Tfp pilus assembly protein FimV
VPGRIDLRAIPPIAIGFVALVAVAALLFLLPAFLSGGGPPPPAASPTEQALVAGESHTPRPQPTRRPQPTARNYAVRAGDTLLKIAARFRVTVEQLQCANNIRDRDIDNLQIGRVLVIPPPGYECGRGSRTPRPARRTGN